MKFNLPLWNSVKLKPTVQKVSSIEIIKSSIEGMYIRKDKNFVTYDENYTHMTPLKWKGYIKNIRDKKVNFIKENVANVGNCLEVGAGDNFNLMSLKWKKFTICDPVIKPYKENKVEFIRGLFEKIRFEKRFDTIIMFNVLEHCNNPCDFIKTSKKLLKNNGQLFITIPIISNQFLQGDFNCLLHEHINYFTKKGIFNLLKKFNLNVSSFYFSNDSALLCVKHKKLGKSFNINENLLNLNEYKKIFKSKEINFYKFLQSYKDKKIAFYGANNGLNILLYKAKLKKLIKKNKIFIVDSDKNKWKKFLGSFSKPISSPKILQYCDIVCISSLSFSEDILKGLKKDKPIFKINEL